MDRSRPFLHAPAAWPHRASRAWGALTVAVVVGTLTLASGIGSGGLTPALVSDCVDDSYEDDDRFDSWEGNHAIRMGTSQSLRLCDEDWVVFDVREGTAYRVETRDLRGGADTLLELWWCAHSWCTELVASDDNSGGGLASRIDLVARGTDPSRTLTARVRDARGIYEDGMAYTLAVSRLERSWVVPVVARAPGLHGTFFVSDLDLFNPADGPVTLDLVLTLSGLREPVEQRSAEVVVEAGRAIRIADVVGSLFGTEGVGSLRIRSPGVEVVASSRTSNSATEGSFAQHVPAVPLELSAFGSHNTHHAFALMKSDSYRTNVGFAEVLGATGTLWIEMDAPDGAELGRAELVLPAWGHFQINDVFRFLGVEEQGTARLSVTSEPQMGVISYASVVDNRSSDASLILGQSMTRAASRAHVPFAVSLDAKHGPPTRTDLFVLAGDDDPQPDVEVRFFPPAGSGECPSVLSLSAGRGELLVLGDVVRSLGRSGVGALTVDRRYRRLLVTSRTYSLSDQGTAGYSVVGVSLSEGDSWVYRDGSRLTVVGIDGSPGHRAAVGWLEAFSFEPGTLAVRLVAADGTYLGGELYPLGEPGCNWPGPRRIDDVFAELGVGGQAGCRVELEVVGGEAKVTGFGVATDLLSGDATYTPALRIPEEIPSSFTLHYRETALLVDRLAESVGSSSLPAGTFSASVDGDGNLGRDDLPTHVVCVYREAPSSPMRAAALRFGDRIDRVAGGGPFWCFIPDWISKLDNTGSATVTLTGSDTTVTFELDAGDNCVLLDTLPESELVEGVLAREYDVDLWGDLGQPGADPQVLAMYRDAASGHLVTAVVTDGDRIAPVDPSHRLLVVVPDWRDAWDNSGWATLWAVPPPRPPFPGPG